MSKEFQNEFLDLIKYADGSYEAIIGNNKNDEVFMRPATEKEIERFENPLPKTVHITELNRVLLGG